VDAAPRRGEVVLARQVNEEREEQEPRSERGREHHAGEEPEQPADERRDRSCKQRVVEEVDRGTEPEQRSADRPPRVAHENVQRCDDRQGADGPEPDAACRPRRGQRQRPGEEAEAAEEPRDESPGLRQALPRAGGLERGDALGECLVVRRVAEPADAHPQPRHGHLTLVGVRERRPRRGRQQQRNGRVGEVDAPGCEGRTQREVAGVRVVVAAMVVAVVADDDQRVLRTQRRQQLCDGRVRLPDDLQVLGVARVVHVRHLVDVEHVEQDDVRHIRSDPPQRRGGHVVVSSEVRHPVPLDVDAGYRHVAEQLVEGVVGGDGHP